MRASTHWLIDTSALRPHVPAFAEVLIPRIAAGLVSVCLVTELEIGYSARSNSDFERISRDVLALLNRVIMPVAAEIEGLTVLHHDGDFDLIAAVTGQPVEWITRSPEPGQT